MAACQKINTVNAEASTDTDFENVPIDVYDGTALKNSFTMTINSTMIARELIQQIVMHPKVPRNIQKNPDGCHLFYLTDTKPNPIPIGNDENLERYQDGLAGENSGLRVIHGSDPPTPVEQQTEDIGVKIH